MYLIGSIAPLVPNEMFLEHEERPAYGLFMAGLGSGCAFMTDFSSSRWSLSS